MTTIKQQPAGPAAEDNGLKLDTETVKDLEPPTLAEVRGGRSSSGASIKSGIASGGI